MEAAWISGCSCWRFSRVGRQWGGFWDDEMQRKEKEEKGGERLCVVCFVEDAGHDAA